MMKTLIPWKSEYEIGLKEVDQQHQHLVEILNQLYDAMSVGKGNAALESILDELTSYTVKHFSTEERYMVVYGFPHYNEHKTEHQTLVDEVKKFKSDYTNGNRTISVGLATYLKEWLLKHILGSDMEMGTYLQKRGLV